MPWDDIIHGNTEVGGEMKDITFNSKTDADGSITDHLLSSGHNTKDQHDAEHGHAWGQNTDNPGHQDRGLGVFDDNGYSND